MVTRRFGGNDIRVTVESVEGPPGKSAYEVWLEQGNTGTEDDFLAAVAAEAAELVEPPPPDGGSGLSAYQVAVLNGFVGTEAQWLASLVGPQGPQGPPGADSTVPGPTGNTGPAGMTWRGTWNNATSYVTNDAVELNGQSYIALQGSTNNNPESSPTRWQLIAAKGAQGQQGDAGTPGQGVPTGGTTGQVLAKTSNADYATGWTTPAAGGGGPTLTKVTADQAFSLVTLANVTNMSFPVTSGVLYRFTFFVAYRAAAATTGARFGVTYPTATTYAATARLAGFGADGTDAEFTGALSTSGDSAMSTAIQATGTDYLAVVEGIILPSANGVLQLQAATEIAASAVTVRNGSHGQLWVIT